MLIPLGILSSSGAAPGDYERIATAFGTGSSAIITFSSIGAEYKHLQIRYTARAGSGGNNLNVTFNGNTSAIYNTHRLTSNGTSRTSSGGSGSLNEIRIGGAIANSGTGARPSVGIIDILDYADTSKAKTLKSIHGYSDLSGQTPPGEVSLVSGMFNDTTAISSITLTGPSSFQTMTRFSLYGIKG
jgi:hypothetical protein